MNEDLAFENPELFVRLGVALALGLLIGLERGWEAREAPEGRRVAGFRTYGMIGLLGGVSALLVDELRVLFLAAGVLVIGALTAVAYWRASASGEDIGLTSAFVAVLTFALGALAGAGELAAAAAAAVVVTLLLGVKPELHAALRRIERAELLASLRLLLISVVVLPVLPDQGYGPWAALNPYRIWWMVVLVAGVSYVGYIAIKWVGARRGVLLTGAFGGLVSSTAVALNLARLGKRVPTMRTLLAAGVAVSAGVMFPRLLVVMAVISPALARALVWPLLAAGAAAIAVAAWFARRDGGATAEDEAAIPRNPLDLRVALQFGLLLAAVMLLARAVVAWIGESGLYLLAAGSGLADVDAISLSLAALVEDGDVAVPLAAGAVLMAAAVNSAVKPVLVAIVCGPAMALRVAAALAAALAAGAAAFWLAGGL